MPIQQLIQPQQNNLIDTFLQAEAIKASRSTNALNEAKAAELPYERERLNALNASKITENTAQTGKAEAETGKVDQEAARKAVEFIARFPGDRNAVLGTFAEWAPKMPQLAPIAERLAGIQDPEQFKSEVLGFAMPVLDQMKENRAERNTQSQIDYRGSMLGKPMVVQTPGGTYSYPQDNPQDVTRMDTGPSKIETAEAVRKQLTPEMASKVRDKLSTIGLIRKQIENVKARFGGAKADGEKPAIQGIKNSYSAGLGGGYLPTEGGNSSSRSLNLLMK